MKKRKALARKGLSHFLEFKIKNTKYIHGGNNSNKARGLNSVDPADIVAITVLKGATSS